MIRHFLASALASIRRTPVTTAANALTLALGLACFFAAFGIATYWRSADGHHRSAAQTFVIGASVTAAGQDRTDVLNALSSPALASHLRGDFPEIEHITRTLEAPEIAVAAGDRKMLADAAYVEPDFLRIFDLDFVAGDPRSALDQPGGVVLTRAMAERLFGSEAALGRSIRVDGAWDATVTGVIAPVRQPSFMGTNPDAPLRFEMLASWASNPRLEQIERQRWLALWGYTFVTLPPGATAEALNARLPAFVARNAPAEQTRAAAITLRAFPLVELTTHTLDNTLFAQSGAQLTAISALTGLGLLTLIIACANYANLATAQAAGRMKETGMRRILGAGRVHVMAQTWLETALLTTAAGIAAFLVLAAANAPVHAATGIDLLFFLTRGVGSAGVVAIVIIAVTLVAGLYPALAQLNARPVEALRSGRAQSGPRLLAQILVGLQFASASFLLVLVTVTQMQRAELERMALAPRQDQVLVLNNLSRLDIEYETLVARLAALPGVESVSVTDKPLLGGGGVNFVQFARSPEPGANAPNGYFKAVGYDYFETLGLDLLAGRTFNRERDPAPVDLFAPGAGAIPAIIVDRTYVRRLGFETPEAAIDATIYVPASFTQAFGRGAQPVRIVGVTETEPTLLESSDAEGTIYTYTPTAPWGGQYPIVRIPRDDAPATLAAITRVWDELAPAAPINVRFFDDLFAQSFSAYARVGQIFILLAACAFIIASIGQLGIVVHAASRRRHEIGVRKILGASTSGIARLLLIDFSKPALIGNAAAWPLGYVASQAYLSAFAHRIDLTPAPFLLSMTITLLVAGAAVSGVVLRTANARPAEVLRHA
jgi:putative ABC transport system permease protein